MPSVRTARTHARHPGTEHVSGSRTRPPRPRALRRLSPLLTFVLVLAIWQFASVTFELRWLPDLRDISGGVVKLVTSGDFAAAGVSTLRTLGLGLGVTLLIGGVMAVALAVSDVIDEALTTVLSALMAVPSVALIPVFILVWGLDDLTSVASIVSFAVLPLTLQWATALREVPAHLVEMSRSFGSTPLQVGRTVYLPSVAPLLLIGVRVAVVQGIKGVISAEVIIGTIGVGKLLTQQSQAFNMAGVWAVIVLIIGASIASYAFLAWLEGRASRWAD